MDLIIIMNFVLYGSGALLALTSFVLTGNLRDDYRIVQRHCNKEYKDYKITSEINELLDCLEKEKRFGGGSSEEVSPLKSCL